MTGRAASWCAPSTRSAARPAGTASAPARPPTSATDVRTTFLLNIAPPANRPGGLSIGPTRQRGGEASEASRGSRHRGIEASRHRGIAASRHRGIEASGAVIRICMRRLHSPCLAFLASSPRHSSRPHPVREVAAPATARRRIPSRKHLLHSELLHRAAPRSRSRDDGLACDGTTTRICNPRGATVVLEVSGPERSPDNSRLGH